MAEASLEQLRALLESEGALGASLAALSAPPEVDLRTLLGEMSALRQEVRAETLATRQLRESLTAPPVAAAAPPPAQPVEAELARERASSRRAQGRQLVEVLDRLSHAVESARRLAIPRRRWFRREVDPGAASLLEGLELMQRQLQERLLDLGFTPIPVAVGDRFDPVCMEAVGAVERAELSMDEVVEVVSAGYQGEERALRLAQVVVNRGERKALKAGEGS